MDYKPSGRIHITDNEDVDKRVANISNQKRGSSKIQGFFYVAKDRKELVTGTEGGDTNCYFPQIFKCQLVGQNHCSPVMSTHKKQGQKANWELVRVHGLPRIIYSTLGKFSLSFSYCEN